MGIHLGRVGHIGIHVSDVDRSIDFYRKVLGLKVTGRWGPPDFGRPTSSTSYRRAVCRSSSCSAVSGPASPCCCS